MRSSHVTAFGVADPVSRKMSMWKRIGILLGSMLLIFGAAGVIFAVIGIVDPVGSKLADDGDPFGVPPSLSDSLWMLAAYFGVGAAGALLLWSCFRKRRLPA